MDCGFLPAPWYKHNTLPQVQIDRNDKFVINKVTASTASTEGGSCLAGQEKSDNGECTACPVDTYGTDGQTCVSCGSGKMSIAGSTSEADCAISWPFPPGNTRRKASSFILDI